MAMVRGFEAEHLEGQPLRVAALDETGQEEQGMLTVGVKRQYMGCAGKVANGVNTVHCSYVTPNGHALYRSVDENASPIRCTNVESCTQLLGN